jgi:hypothetical protein
MGFPKGEFPNGAFLTWLGRTPVAPMSAATRMVRRLAANKGFIDATVGNAGMRTGGVSAPVSRRHSLSREESRLEMKLGN